MLNGCFNPTHVFTSVHPLPKCSIRIPLPNACTYINNNTPSLTKQLPSNAMTHIGALKQQRRRPRYVLHQWQNVLLDNTTDFFINIHNQQSHSFLNKHAANKQAKIAHFHLHMEIITEAATDPFGTLSIPLCSPFYAG